MGKIIKNIIGVSLQALGKLEEAEKCLKMAKEVRKRKR
jgi:hypothetical protein